MNDNYWTRRARAATLRRRAFLSGAGLATVGTAAILAVGCGDDDDDEPGPAGTVSPTSQATSQATTGAVPRRGGVANLSVASFPAIIDPHQNVTAAGADFADNVYSKLFQTKGLPLGPDYPSLEIVPDVAEGYEVTDDGLTYTMKLRRNVKWQPPVSRPLIASDVLYNWNKINGKVEGFGVALQAAQFHMVDSLTAPDDYTLVWKLKAPNALFLPALADNYTFMLQPPEIDPTKEVVGSGAWIMAEMKPGVGWTLKRNPEWHFGPDRPYLDELRYSVIQDTATALNQFKGGNLSRTPGGTAIKEISSIRSAVKDAQIIQVPESTANYFIGFSGSDGNPLWKDPRIRQALTRALDRDSLWNAVVAPRDVEAAGLPPQEIWYQNVIPHALGKYWIDPTGDKASAQVRDNVKYDPKVAMQLIEAAGHGKIETQLTYTKTLSPAAAPIYELAVAMLNQAGWNIKLDPVDAQVYSSQVFGKAEWTGLCENLNSFGMAEQWLVALYIDGPFQNWARVDDDVLNKGIAKMLATLDGEDRLKQIHELQNHGFEQLYYVPVQYPSGPSYSIWQAGFHDVDKYMTPRSGQGFWNSHWWYEG